MKSKILLLVLIISVSGSLFAQEEIGKIFTSTEADSLYGKVIESYTMNADSLIKILKETKDKIMFRVQDKKAIIAGNNRSILYPNGSSITDKEVLRVYSINKVLELIASGRKDVVVIQLREATTTIENGNLVLERGFPCPPYCE